MAVGRLTIRRFGRPEEITAATSISSPMTPVSWFGAVLVIDGGSPTQ